MSRDEYYEYPRFSGGINYGTIHYKYDSYRVKAAAFVEVSHCTNMKWMVEALEVLALQKIQSGEYEDYFRKISN